MSQGFVVFFDEEIPDGRAFEQLAIFGIPDNIPRGIGLMGEGGKLKPGIVFINVPDFIQERIQTRLLSKS